MTDETDWFRGNAALSARYRLLERLGEGGTGMVFRASRSDGPTGEVAVKVLAGGRTLPFGWRADPSRLTSLDHPHLVRIRDCGELGGEPFLEMDYLAGGTLRRALTPGTAWPIRRTAEVLFQLADALSYLHERGLLHLDLKPENVLLSPEGVRLADLDGVVPRGTGRLTWERGSPDYCAPEQRFGLPVDERADIFALAALGYELLTGSLPGRVFFPCTRRDPSLPGGLDDVFRASLSRDPHDRPATARDFGQRLRDALHLS